MKVLVTGAAGFIGYHVSRALLARGDEVVGLDNLNAYYDVSLKEARRDQLLDESGFRFELLDLADTTAMSDLFAREAFGGVVHLGAQAGVRYSIEDPHSYVSSNLTGFTNVLEGCRNHSVGHLVFASTSSVYGANTTMPFSEGQSVDHPLSFYAATKKANEVMAHVYAHLYGVATTGLRFFTVYGPWGRPDMALFTFTRKMLAGKPIDVYNHGKHERDFTYVGDITEGVVRALDRVPVADPGWNPDAPDPRSSNAPFRIFNIGNSKPVALMRYIEVLENCLGIVAEKNFLPMQPGDVPATWADVSDLENAVGYRPATSVEEGVARFVDWYLEYYGRKPADDD